MEEKYTQENDENRYVGIPAGHKAYKIHFLFVSFLERGSSKGMLLELYGCDGSA